MRHVILSALLLFLGGAAALAAEQGKPAPAEGKGEDVYARITAAYMGGDWEELAKALAARPAEMARLTRAQRADVDYVRQALAECRPAWWNTLKAGKKAAFIANVWGRPVNVTFDPDAKGQTQFKIGEPKVDLTVGAEAMALDSPDTGEYGYLKGDLAGLGMWQTLSSAAAMSNLPPKQMALIGDKDKLRFSMYVTFRGNLGALYYGTPPIRRWGLHIYLAAYMPEFGQGDVAAARRAAAAMLLVEILRSPSTYPSLPLPDSLAAEEAETKLAVHYKFMLKRGSAWTIAEDKAFRAAVRAFASANELKVLEAAKVTLPNNLTFAMMPGEDEHFQTQRDKFIKAAFDKIKAAAK
jgi:hypothetical protein